MADAVIIAGSLDDKELRDSISKLVTEIDKQMGKAADSFDTGVRLMESSLSSFTLKAKSSVKEMKDAFGALGTTFDDFARAMSAAASGGGRSSSTGGRSGASGVTTTNTVEALREEIREAERLREKMSLYSDELKRQNDLIEQQKRQLREVTAGQEKRLQSTRIPILKEFNAANTMSTKSIADAEAKLIRLQDVAKTMRRFGIFDEAQINRVNKAIETTEKKIEQLRDKAPKSFKDILGMDESSVDAISKKMSALKTLTIDPKNTSELRRLSEEYQRLKNLQNQMLGNNAQLAQSNARLAETFNYIGKRIVYALTIGSLTSFARQVYEVRGQYEMLERSLGVLVNSFQNGTRIFNELNQMAIKSPFTLIDLAGAAKQLVAYDFAANEVVDTTRRLADISAALGVPMERLTYNLGQIRAQTVLTARDARDFANAGLPMVKALADYFSELEGRVVSTGDVYDRMSKKMVSYNDVMAVLNKMTDEGGKFFDFQAKQAETLRVQIANLQLAWNNMLNDIGQSNQSLLTAPIQALKSLLLHWKEVSNVVTALSVILGSAALNQLLLTKAFGKGTIAIVNKMSATRTATAAEYENLFATKYLTAAQGQYLIAMHKTNTALKDALINLNVVTAAQAKAAASGGRVMSTFYLLKGATITLGQAIKSLGASLITALLNPITIAMALISAIIGVVQAINSAKEAAAELNRTITQNADENAKAIANYLKSYKDLGDNTTIVEQEKAWERVKEEIENSTAAHQEYLASLLQEPDVKKRVEQANELLKKTQQVNEMMSMWKADDIKIDQGFLFFSDGLVDNIKDVTEELNKSFNTAELIAKKWDTYQREGRLFGTTPLDLNINDLTNQTKELAESLKKQFKIFNITDEEQMREAMFKVTQDIATQNRLDVEQLFTLRVFLERQLGIERKTSLYEFMKFAKTTSSDIFKDVTQEQIDNGTWYNDEMREKLNNVLEKWKENNKLGVADIQDRLNDISWMSLIIPVYFDYKKSLTDLQKDFVERTGLKEIEIGEASTVTEIVDNAIKEVDKLEKELDNLKKAGVNSESLILGKNYKETEEELQKQIAIVHAYGQLTKKEQKEIDDRNKKAEKKDILGDAISKEIQLISDIQKKYKEYRSAGMSAYQAMTTASSEYGKSLKNVNAQISKFGIKTLTSDQLSSMSLQDIRTFYQEQINGAASSAKAVESLEKAVASLNSEIAKVDYKFITDSLNNTLSKLNDEYELSVELDANPELGNVFKDMFNIDTSGFVDNIDDYMARVQQAFDEYRLKLNIEIPLDVFKSDMEKIKGWAKSADLDQSVTDALVGSLAKPKGKVSDWAKNVIKQTQDLEYKLADTEGKIAIKQREIDDLQMRANEERNEMQKALLDKQVEQAKREMEELKAEALQLLPFYEHLFNGIEKSRKRTRELVQQGRDVISKAREMGANADGLFTLEQDGKTAQVTAKKLLETEKKLNQESEKTDSIWAKISKKFDKTNKDTYDIKGGIQLIADKAQDIGESISALADIGQQLGLDEDTVEVMGDVGNTITGISNAAKSLAQGDISGTITGLWTAVSTWLDNTDKKIQRQIKDSETNVKSLEVAYKSLQYAIEDAYGTAVIGAQRAAIENKKLQLAELERQLALEKSRKKKNQDQDRIIELQGQITDLKNEIVNATKDIVNNLLGVSSVGDAAEQMVSSMISAFRNGEDYMKVYQDSFQDMIDNMIMKAIVGQVVGQRVQAMFDAVERETTKRADKTQYTPDYLNPYAYGGRSSSNLNRGGTFEEVIKNQEELIELYTKEGNTKMVEALQKRLEKIMEAYSKAATPRVEDIQAVSDMWKDWQQQDKETFDAYMDMLGIKYGSGADKSLSNLQQGIQSITEQTAGALEAIMSGMSQQVYLQSDILTQIRDAVSNFDIDVQTATQTQMLLQLQSSHLIIQSIHSLMEGWNNASGQALRVELVS